MARASPSGEREPPWQPTPSPLARIAEARSGGRDEHLVRDTEASQLNGRQGAAATHRAASVAYAVAGAALTGWPGGTYGYRPISARSHRRLVSPQPSTTLPTPWPLAA